MGYKNPLIDKLTTDEILERYSQYIRDGIHGGWSHTVKISFHKNSPYICFEELDEYGEIFFIQTSEITDK